MKTCSKCELRLAQSSRFCPQCGTPQLSNSSVAGASSLIHERGGALAATKYDELAAAQSKKPKIRSERKQVTVLFVDLCDSTAHVMNSDPEEAKIYLDGALLLMTDAVDAYGGTVSQLLGDGLLALFGAPVSQEDHALRACLAAQTMQTGARLKSPMADAPSASLRIGIHSGEVLVGLTGRNLWSHYRADGTTIHLASRLEKLAVPGSTLISASTHRLLAGEIDTQALGVHSIRGLDGPLELFELVQGAEGSAAAPLARRQRWAPMIGRQELLQLLNSMATAANQGAMRVIGLRGEAGIGKSRLISEWCGSAALEEFSICTTLARGYSSANAYGVISDVARSLIGQKNNPAMSNAMRTATTAIEVGFECIGPHRSAINDLLGFADSDKGWLALSPSLRRRRITDALQWLIAERLKFGSLLIVLEDIFLADRESQRVLESVVPRLEGLPVLICLSYRQDFAHRWADSVWFIEHWIAPLPESSMRALANAMVGSHDSVNGVVTELVERADGNPLFLEQMVITLIDEGSMLGTPGAYRLIRPEAELRVPATISTIICARVDRLSHAAKAALEAAAVLGDPLTCDLIGAMTGGQAYEIDRLLRLSVASGLLILQYEPAIKLNQGIFTFRHALVQEVIDSTLTKPRRKALHRRAFLALKGWHGTNSSEAAPTLTRHAFRGELWDQAAAYAVKSMGRAVSRSANREALRLFELGLDSARRVESQPQALALELALQLEAIGALMALGQIDAIFTNLERADVIAEKLEDQRSQATVSLQTSVFLWMRGKYTKGVEFADRALNAGLLAERRNLQMAACQSRMMMFHGLGRYREAVEEALMVLRDYEQELLPHRLMPGWATAPIINLYSFQGSSLWRLGDYQSAQKVLNQAYEILQSFDHPYSCGLIDFVQAQMWIELGQFDDAERLMLASVESCTVNDIPTLLPCSVSMLAGTMARSGHAQRSAELLQDAIRDRIYLAGGTYGELFIRLSMGVASRKLDHWDDAINFCSQAVELAETGEQYGHRAEALFELAESFSCAGHADEANGSYLKALEQARLCGMPFYIERISRCFENLKVGESQ